MFRHQRDLQAHIAASLKFQTEVQKQIGLFSTDASQRWPVFLRLHFCSEQSPTTESCSDTKSYVKAVNWQQEWISEKLFYFHDAMNSLL